MKKSSVLDWTPETAPCPFENDEFLKVWVTLLGMGKWKKKPLTAIKLACDKLKRFHIDFAASLVENAIIGNYQGVVFADTEQRYNNWLFQKEKQNGQSNSISGAKYVSSYKTAGQDAFADRFRRKVEERIKPS